MRVITMAVGLGLLAGMAGAQDVKRTLTQVTDDIWRFDNNFHVSIVVDTGDGLVVGDPINAEAVTWLKAELAGRFDQPVTHMIFSHSHGDHASGGQAWGDDVTVVAHEKFADGMAAGNVVTAAPDVTFTDTHSFTVGEKTFNLKWLGAGGHGEDMIAWTVEPDRVAFAVDVVNPRRLPFRHIPSATVEGFIGQVAAVEAMEFDILVPGHSSNGTKEDVTAGRVYMEELRAAVQAELDAGTAHEEIIASLKMPDYAGWGQYDAWLGQNVEGMIRMLTQ